MPKFQSRFASAARRIQAATGIAYTDVLRLLVPDRRELRLADELRHAGLVDAANALVGVTFACAESTAWYDAYGEIENACYETDPQKVKDMGAACQEGAEAVMRRAGFADTVFGPDAEVLHAAYLALCRAGAVPDGRRLARAALGVFDCDPLLCSDIIRTAGRRPFAYRIANELTGPSTATAVAARKAARAMAAASDIQTGDDRYWYEAAELMVGAAWYGSIAAGHPPLHSMREFQSFYKTMMDGPVDDFPDSAMR
uniref:Uncharacterized protein n=1 Tax=Streptomyces sp. F12 TaxID=1436084 RepID=V9Z4S3_9ACTN|nr:hypothetical protein [Streptomyces sp. F12]AHE40470.1 hypothetical protein pFRL6_383 [Streptomyces sp. F12]